VLGAAILHARLADGNVAQRRLDLTLRQRPVAHHQPVALPVPQRGVGLDVFVDLVLDGRAQHLLRALTQDLVQRGTMVLDLRRIV